MFGFGSMTLELRLTNQQAIRLDSLRPRRTTREGTTCYSQFPNYLVHLL